MNEKLLKQCIDELSGDIGFNLGLSIWVIMSRSMRSKYDLLSKNVFILKQDFKNRKGNSIEILEKRYFEICQEKTRLNMILWCFTSIPIGILFSITIYFRDPLFSTINKTFGVANIEKYIMLGLLGAIIYFLTDRISEKNTKVISSAKTLFQFSIALVMPLIVIGLFFSGNEALSGAAKKATKIKVDTAGLFSFVLGYSSRLALLFLNKIVEKGEKMIKAI